MPYGVYEAGVVGEVSSTYESRHLTFSESQLTHPSHADGLVDKNDPVLVGNIVGVAFASAVANTDLIAIDTEGIWQLSVVAQDEDGNSAVAVGDQIYINTSTAILSKIKSTATIPFGRALYPISAGVTDVIPVKVHCDPSTTQTIVDFISQEVDHADFTDNGDATGYIDLTTQLPVGAIPLGVKYVVSEGFAGDTTAVVQTGVAGDLDRFSSVTDQSVLAIATVGHGVPADACDGIGGAQTIRVTVTGGVDWGNITAGTMVVTIYFLRT